jgi:hypothetical protein
MEIFLELEEEQVGSLITREIGRVVVVLVADTEELEETL